MRIFADVHISPITVQHLTELGHDVIRANSVLPENAPDREIVAWAISNERVVLTQDLGFSEIVALSGAIRPSIITLRLPDSRLETVNRILGSALPGLEEPVTAGVIVTVEERRVRIRELPVRYYSPC